MWLWRSIFHIWYMNFGGDHVLARKMNTKWISWESGHTVPSSVTGWQSTWDGVSCSGGQIWPEIERRVLWHAALAVADDFSCLEGYTATLFTPGPKSDILKHVNILCRWLLWWVRSSRRERRKRERTDAAVTTVRNRMQERETRVDLAALPDVMNVSPPWMGGLYIHL